MKTVAQWLRLRNAADLRPVGLVVVYVSLLLGMYFVDSLRNLPVFIAACALSFINTLVLHSSLHKGPFTSDAINRGWYCVLSFGSLYPASTNVPAHNRVHHHFSDHGNADWAHPGHTRFRWNLLNLLHFPNVVGPNTFFGTDRYAKRLRNAAFRRQHLLEQAVAFGLTGLLLIFDFWGALFFVLMPQLWGARGVLRLNHIQHDGCDLTSRYNHSRNFVSRPLNWLMCNDGYHTIHHNKAGLHWSTLPAEHERQIVAHMDPVLDEASMVGYLVRAYALNEPSRARPSGHRVDGAGRGTAPLS